MKEIITYLNFDGNCREAMKFYERCLSGELQMASFADQPGGNASPEAKDRIMHAKLTKGSATLMASDTQPGSPFKQGNNFAICLSPDSAPETDNVFNALSEGGKITMPLQDTFWGARFGMVTDRFGINWMVNFEKPKA